MIDLFSRKVVGWSMGARMKAQLVSDALLMAIWQRQPQAGLVVHFNRGSQYASIDYRKLLSSNKYCWQHESIGKLLGQRSGGKFFGSLKQERVQ